MEFVASTLGLPPVAVSLFSHRPGRKSCRSRTSMSCPSEGMGSIQSSLSLLCHHDSLLCHADKNARPRKAGNVKHYCGLAAMNIEDEEDDGTVITTTSSCSSSLGRAPGVTFAEPLVTHVHTRPKTSRQEKKFLFYTDREYRTFRREYSLCGGREPRDSVVQFSDELVSEYHVYPMHQEKDQLYYSECDLKR